MSTIDSIFIYKDRVFGVSFFVEPLLIGVTSPTPTGRVDLRAFRGSYYWTELTGIEKRCKIHREIMLIPNC